jgi:hypothetical protein
VEIADKFSRGRSPVNQFHALPTIAVMSSVLRVVSKISLMIASAIARLINTLFRRGGW